MTPQEKAMKIAEEIAFNHWVNKDCKAGEWRVLRDIIESAILTAQKEATERCVKAVQTAIGDDDVKGEMRVWWLCVDAVKFAADSYK